MIDDLLNELNNLKFPHVSEGDSINFKSFWFIYQNGIWISDDQKNQSILAQLAQENIHFPKDSE